MDQESWLSCEKTAVLQGGFLLANQICQPEPLSSLRKEDWDRVGRPIVNAVKEICEHSLRDGKDRLHWRKKILCIVWRKVLEVRNRDDIDIKWKEDPLFAVQNSLPDINHTILFELVKSMCLSTVYVELLLCCQPAEQCKELELLVNHVTSSSTEADIKLLLEVWWELLKGKRGYLDTLDHLFTAQCSHCNTATSEPSPHASKRFKLDPESTSTCMVHILFEGLNQIKEHFTSSDLCFFALSNCLDTLYTYYLLSNPADLSIEVKLQNISRSVSLRKRNEVTDGFDLIEVICEAQRDLAAALTPAETKPCGMTFIQAMQVSLEIICSWEVMGLLKMPTNEPSATSIRLKDSLCRVLASLEQPSHAKDLIGNGQTLNNLKITLKGLLASLVLTVPESSATEMAHIAMAILDNNLEGFQGLPKWFASKLIQDFNEAEWIQCLERNKSVFQTKDLMTLISTLIDKCQSDADMQYCKKLKDVIVDIFCQLSSPNKNATLKEMLSLSKKGLHGFLPSSVTVGFTEELNLAFNCIIQSSANSNLDAAVSAVSRMAFQNPEATLRRCCHMAVVNVGAHTLIAEILQQLSGLISTPGDSLLCRCLQDTVWSKLSSPQEENQFLQFLAELMKCKITGCAGEKQSFLPPEEALRVFVQPYLSSSSSSCKIELCLRLLQSALSQDNTNNSTHWVMSCSPFPLLYCLAQLLNECSRCWELPIEDKAPISMESKELLLSVLNTLGTIVGKEVACAPDVWSRALFWLYSKVEELDWTVRFYLKEVWGQHFKYEVPNSLLAVCNLPEQEWSGLELPQYGLGTGLLAWLECCTLSDHVLEAMLEYLSLNLLKPDDVNMFSKGLLVAVSQILPWCTTGEWDRLLKVLQELLRSGKLYVPFSLEYVDFLPLLDLRSFADELRLSVFLLRIFQLLCGSSCSDWLPPQGWVHTGRLYANAMRGITSSVSEKMQLPSAMESPKTSLSKHGACSQEVLFVFTQLFCHVLHVQVMIPGQPESLFLCALEILTHYEAVLSAYPNSCTALQGLNTRHFFTTIANNLQCADMKAVLHQKIAQL
ncbi:gem-associated protein 4 [Myxocyprinus asiaticus]|uniref:gem-associated protein 4 n=1 Tax=Myxocyprinus asiaticus TaxID=70543 RepID=UPI0022216F9B|nr:gem-associated protein 4 [Myxocyprinus asiaticus]